jgi:hypothetical protein
LTAQPNSEDIEKKNRDTSISNTLKEIFPGDELEGKINSLIKDYNVPISSAQGVISQVLGLTIEPIHSSSVGVKSVLAGSAISFTQMCHNMMGREFLLGLDGSNKDNKKILTIIITIIGICVFIHLANVCLIIIIIIIIIIL